MVGLTVAELCVKVMLHHTHFERLVIPRVPKLKRNSGLLRWSFSCRYTLQDTLGSLELDG